MSRKRFTEQQVIETLWIQGVSITCFRCGGIIQPVLLGAEKSYYFPLQREHIHEIELGGPDTPANCRYSHIECHSIVTNGTPATSAGSSKHRIAKAKRIVRTGKMVPKKRLTRDEAVNEALEAFKRGMRKYTPKRKMQSRPFQKQPRRAK